MQVPFLTDRQTAAPVLVLVLALVLTLLAVGLPLTAFGQINFVATELPQTELDGQLIFEDLNGDGRRDMVDVSWQPDLGRELLIYDQLPDGRFNTTPRRIEIKSEIIAVGFADMRSDPGKELLLFTNSDVFTLSTARDGYAGNLKPVAQWQLIADMPDPDRLQFFRELQDIDGDGITDLLLPGQESYGYLRGQADESFQLVHEFSTINPELDPGLMPTGGGGLSTSLSINPEQGINISVTAQRPSPFAGLVEDWQADSPRTGNLMTAERWMPSAQLADFNGDGRADIVFQNVGLDIRGQINLLWQSANGQFAASPDWQGSIDTRGDIRLVDLDGDAFTDLVRLTGDGQEWEAFLFRNQSGSFNFAQPDQIMRFSGFDVTLNFHDLTGDERPELVVSFYTIPVLEAIRNTSILRTQLLFARDSTATGQIFNRRPEFRLEESFSATNVRGLTEQMSLHADVDNDGSKDAVFITDAGALAAKRVATNLRIADQPFWQYVPNHTVLRFQVQDLNDDGRSDVVLRHDNSVTLLVARP